MRTVPYREVVYAIAEKVGLDPRRDFQVNQFWAITTFINVWVRRLWDKADFPEWTTIQQFTPANHVVYYEQDLSNQLGRVLKVFLTDPLASNIPTDTPFRLLDFGVHCGFDHGSSVWIKFLRREPQFTADLWDSTVNYNAGDLVYFAGTGECYSSLGNNNLNHSPAPVGRRAPVPTVISQGSVADIPGFVAQPKIIDIDFSPITTPNPNGTLNTVSIYSDTPPATFLTSDNYTGASNATATAIRNGLLAALQADANLSAFTITGLSSPLRIRLQAPSDFSVYPTPFSHDFTISEPRTYLNVIQVQSFVPTVSPTAGQAQFVDVTFTPDLIAQGQIYNLTFTDTLGAVHEVSYTALAGDTIYEVLKGLALAIPASSDAYFKNVGVTIDSIGTRLIISTPLSSAVDATYQQSPTPVPPIPNPPVPIPPTYWAYVPFPHDLALQVIQGAYADYLKMEGQTDKGMAEEQGALGQQGEVVGAKIAPPYPPLTDQQVPAERFRKAG